MGEKTAFIFYDHGIRETIDSFPKNQLVRFDLAYKSPNEHGFPTDDEFEIAKALEDRIESFMISNDGAYVGRVTTAGHRYFYCFTDITEELIRPFCDELNVETGYYLDHRVKNDPEKSGYWKDLFPTEDDWQMILDSRTVEALKHSGDTCELERRIEHWAYFKSKADAKTYVAWLESQGFSLESVKRSKPFFGDWRVRFYRLDTPELYAINKVTYKLRHKAIATNGKYDGWETSVEKE